MDKMYAKLNDDGKISILYFSPQNDDTLVEIDVSYDIYKDFYDTMPEFIRISLPVPVTKK